jgi:hypothetical protein
MSANALPDAPYYRPEPAATGEHSNHSMANETVVFVTPRYDRYVWPYELCRSYEVRRTEKNIPSPSDRSSLPKRSSKRRTHPII